MEYGKSHVKLIDFKRNTARTPFSLWLLRSHTLFWILSILFAKMGQMWFLYPLFLDSFGNSTKICSISLYIDPATIQTIILLMLDCFVIIIKVQQNYRFNIAHIVEMGRSTRWVCAKHCFWRVAVLLIGRFLSFLRFSLFVVLRRRRWNVNQEPHRYVLDKLYRATDLSIVFSHPDWSGFAMECGVADAHAWYCIERLDGCLRIGLYIRADEWVLLDYIFALEF